ncbi:MAG TPA: hypothetical protein VL976_09830 [Xanthobacteraceae bacterium]|nr:hypothetical protein [Xanthobacteraceae bacterium]
MAIYRLLQNQAFEPDDIEGMTVAYEAALKVLRLANRSDPITEIVAERIIAIAQTGMRDPAKLRAAELKDFDIPPEPPDE